MTIGTVIYPVKDLDRAKAVFGALLGVEPVMDEPYYVGYQVGDQQIGLDPNGHGKGMTGPVPYKHVEDVKATLAKLVEAGAEINEEPTDYGDGKLVASVKDPDGNVIGLRQA
jgi:predicted enzyme related to lactoylglutathione lyase